MTESTQEKSMLPLDAPRLISIRVAQNTCTWHFRRITNKDWEKFFGGITNRSMRHGGTEERVFDADAPLLELVDATLKSVAGYEGAEGEWKQKLPLRHKLAVGMVLRTVAVDPPEEGPLSDLAEVRLTASWSAAEDGRMNVYQGLVHRFRHPGVEQLRKFNLECSRARILGSGDEGITIYPARQAVAMRLYDELIESVDGYSVNGEPLKDAEEIKSEMDGAHKAAAALALFEAGEPVEIL
jgi:hypothetical protein